MTKEEVEAGLKATIQNVISAFVGSNITESNMYTIRCAIKNAVILYFDTIPPYWKNCHMPTIPSFEVDVCKTTRILSVRSVK